MLQPYKSLDATCICFMIFFFFGDPASNTLLFLEWQRSLILLHLWRIKFPTIRQDFKHHHLFITQNVRNIILAVDIITNSCATPSTSADQISDLCGFCFCFCFFKGPNRCNNAFNCIFSNLKELKDYFQGFIYNSLCLQAVGRPCSEVRYFVSFCWTNTKVTNPSLLVSVDL